MKCHRVRKGFALLLLVLACLVSSEAVAYAGPVEPSASPSESMTSEPEPSASTSMQPDGPLLNSPEQMLGESAEVVTVRLDDDQAFGIVLGLALLLATSTAALVFSASRARSS